MSVRMLASLPSSASRRCANASTSTMACSREARGKAACTYVENAALLHIGWQDNWRVGVPLVIHCQVLATSSNDLAAAKARDRQAVYCRIRQARQVSRHAAHATICAYPCVRRALSCLLLGRKRHTVYASKLQAMINPVSWWLNVKQQHIVLDPVHLHFILLAVRKLEMIVWEPLHHVHHADLAHLHRRKKPPSVKQLLPVHRLQRLLRYNIASICTRLFCAATTQVGSVVLSVQATRYFDF